MDDDAECAGRAAFGVVVMTAASTPAWSQSQLPPVTASVNMTGPRFGLTMLTQESVYLHNLRSEMPELARHSLLAASHAFPVRFVGIIEVLP